MSITREHRVNSTDNQQARIQAQAQWNANPCGAIPTDAYDRGFFERVEQERYRQQYWQKDFFDFQSFRDDKVLEIGVGLGTDLKQFARSGADCFGVDITEKHLALARRNFEIDGFDVKLQRADATKLPFPDNFFDCVYSFGVIHHIPDARLVVNEVYRVLKSGGVFQVAVYNLFSIHSLFLFLRAVLRGEIGRLGVPGVLATIEKGADGITLKPYVKLYSSRELKRLLEEQQFTIRKFGIRHVSFDSSTLQNVFRPLERLIGWYICAQGRKV